MKFCRPVFRAVNRADPEAAKSTFMKYRSAFHPIARRLIEKVRIDVPIYFPPGKGNIYSCGHFVGHWTCPI